MPKVKLHKVDYSKGRYPEVLSKYTKGITDQISSARVGELAGLTQFGVNKTILPPGSATALIHWHEQEDEFVIILSGTATLIDGDVEQELRPGDCAGFKAGVPSGHAILNRSKEDVVLFEIGSRAPMEVGHYPGVDLEYSSESHANKRVFRFSNLDGKEVFFASRKIVK
jgi:uncharacterized cupin superfamily protein